MRDKVVELCSKNTTLYSIIYTIIHFQHKVRSMNVKEDPRPLPLIPPKRASQRWRHPTQMKYLNPDDLQAALSPYFTRAHRKLGSWKMKEIFW